MVAAPLLETEPPDADCLVLYGDVPLLRASTLHELMERHRLEGNGVTVLTAEVEDPKGYGRILRDARGGFARITEDRDLEPEQRGIREINSGIYTFQLAPLLRALGSLRADNSQKEYYLTDALTVIRDAGLPVGVFLLGDAEEISGHQHAGAVGRGRGRARAPAGRSRGRLPRVRPSRRGMTSCSSGATGP